MFERFTAEARATVVAAQEEARALGHERFGSGHLLLGLLAVGDGPAGRALRAHDVTPSLLRPIVDAQYGGLDAAALAAIGVDLDAVRRETEDVFGEGALDGARGRRRGHVPFDAEGKKTLELALRVVIQAKHRTISGGHILLAVLRQPDAVGVRALRALRVDPAELTKTTTREISAQAA